MPCGESGPQFLERLTRALNQIIKENPTGSVLIVGHAGANGQLLRAMLNPPQGTKMGSQSNDEMYLIEMGGGSPPRVFKYLPMSKLGEL